MDLIAVSGNVQSSIIFLHITILNLQKYKYIPAVAIGQIVGMVHRHTHHYLHWTYLDEHHPVQNDYFHKIALYKH